MANCCDKEVQEHESFFTFCEIVSRHLLLIAKFSKTNIKFKAADRLVNLCIFV